MMKKDACPVCAGTQATFLFDATDRMLGVPGVFRVVRCDSCGLLFLCPMPDTKELAKYYPSGDYYAYSAQTKKGFFWNLREYLIIHYYQPTIVSRLLTIGIPNVPAIPSYVHKGRILDVGCGTGDTLIMLKRLGWDVYGMDMDAHAVAVAKKRGVTHTRVGTYEDIARYPDGYFDVIRMYHVIEHLDNPKACLCLVKRKLKKGGEAIIGTPNAKSLVARLFGTFWYNLDAPRHVLVFHPSNLRALLVDTGFSVAKAEFCSAGGWAGSISYVLREKTNIRADFIHSLWFVLFLYPLERMLDLISLGDIFVLRANKP